MSIFSCFPSLSAPLSRAWAPLWTQLQVGKMLDLLSTPHPTQTPNVEDFWGSNSGTFPTAVSNNSLFLDWVCKFITEISKTMHEYPDLMSILLPSKQFYVACPVSILLNTTRKRWYQPKPQRIITRGFTLQFSGENRKVLEEGVWGHGQKW